MVLAQNINEGLKDFILPNRWTLVQVVNEISCRKWSNILIVFVHNGSIYTHRCVSKGMKMGLYQCSVKDLSLQFQNIYCIWCPNGEGGLFKYKKYCTLG